MSSDRQVQNPYRGLVPYAEEDAPFFFGRDEERTNIIANLLGNRVTTVFGASGVGKTSVLRAGVTHKLREDAKAELTERGAAPFLVAVFDAWRDDPIAGIEAAVGEAATDLFSSGVELTPSSDRLAETLRRWTNDLGCDLLIILDQVEEYFLYHGGEDGDSTFTMQFSRAVTADDLTVNFLLSIRDDGLSQLDRFKGRIPGLLSNLLPVEHLDLSAARAAIQRPLDEYNRRAPNEPPWSVEPELVELVLEELQPGRVVLGVTGQGATGPGATEPARHDRRVETPFLQLVMTQLWAAEVAAGSHILRAVTLSRLGGARQIVRSHLDQAMQELEPAEQDLAAQIFHYLVTPSGNKIAYTAADLAGYTELPQAPIARLLERLSVGARRVVRPVGPAPDGTMATRYQVFHDVLIPAILDWKARHVILQAADERLRLARRRLRRLAGLASVLGLLLIAVVTLALLALYQSHRADVQRQRAASLFMLDQAEDSARAQPDVSSLLSLAAYRLRGSDEGRSNAMLQADRRRDARTLLTGATGALAGAAFSRDGRLIAAGDAAWVRVWDVPGHRQVALLSGGTGQVRGVAFSPDGEEVAAADATGVRLWDVGSRRQVAVLAGGTYGARSVAFSPDGEHIAAADVDGVRVWDLRTRRRVALLPASAKGADSALFTADGRTLVSASSETSRIVLWDARRYRIRRTLRGHEGGTAAIALSPDGATLVSSGAFDNSIVSWNLASGRSSSDTLTDESGASSLAFRRDGRTIAAVTDNGAMLALWDLGRRARIRGLAGNVGAVGSVAFSPDGSTLAASGQDHAVALFDVPARLPIGHSGYVWRAAFSPDGRTLATGGRDHSVVVWDVQTRTPRAILHGHDADVIDVAFAPDGRTLATAGFDHRVILWDPGRGTRLRAPTFTARGDYRLAFSPAGPLLALAGADGTISLWDSRRWARLAVLQGSRSRATTVAFSRDGRRVAVGGEDGRVGVWDVASRTRLADLPAHSRIVNRVAFKPDDAGVLASASDDGEVIVWDLRRRAPSATFPGVNVQFSPDGTTLATLQSSESPDSGIVLWNLARGMPTGRLTYGTSGVFSPDGRLFATVGDDVVFHDLEPAWWQRKLCALAGREMTTAEWARFAPGVRKVVVCG